MRTRCSLLLATLWLVVTAGAQTIDRPFDPASFADASVASFCARLGVTAEQARQLLPPLRKLQTGVAELDRELAAEQAAVVPALTAERQALQAGRTVPDAAHRALARYLAAERRIEAARTAAYQTAYDAVVSLLTAPQQQWLASQATASAIPPSGPEQTQRALLLQERGRAIYTGIARLMRDARETPDPKRFRAFAPETVGTQVTELTSLTPGQAGYAELTSLFLAGVTRVYRMMPADVVRYGPSVAAQLTKATLDVLGRMEADRAGAQSTAEATNPELGGALRTGRVVAVLEQLAGGLER